MALKTCYSYICKDSVPFQMEIRKISRRRPRFVDMHRRMTWSFHVVVLRRTRKKCSKNYNARAQQLFCSLNLLFGDVLVAVVVVVCLSHLMMVITKRTVMTVCGYQEHTTYKASKKKSAQESLSIK